ncbi:hypothetical protein ACFZ8E_19560 [Methylobacterium sp. HMF5984]|uniref:hypothetical protein n=1 Tax=Methylobacterium sp. HMF5984 TaxID=3367370 RepID=UPI003852E986
MFSNGYNRFYHYHLKKCGGTSFNEWLDMQVTEERRCRSGWIGDWLTANAEARDSREIFYCSDGIHTHAPLLSYAPSGTFAFTVLREPSSRLLSQVADWRRLSAQDWSKSNKTLQQMGVDVVRLPLKEFLVEYGRAANKVLLDNYLVRAMAACRVGNLARDTIDAQRLLDPALRALEDFDVVGLTENLMGMQIVVSKILGFAPPGKRERRNETRSFEILENEYEPAEQLIQDLTFYDQVIYKAASRLWASRHASLASDASSPIFPEGAVAAVKRLRPTMQDGWVTFTVRDVLVGTGFHGRDGVGTDQCAVWTGPTRVAVLYIPVPAHYLLKFQILVRGYADESQRNRLQIRVDGVIQSYYFEDRNGYRDAIVFEATPSREIINITFDFGCTIAGNPALPLQDIRERGFNFDCYGWQYTL